MVNIMYRSRWTHYQFKTQQKKPFLLYRTYLKSYDTFHENCAPLASNFHVNYEYCQFSDKTMRDNVIMSRGPETQ